MLWYSTTNLYSLISELQKWSITNYGYINTFIYLQLLALSGSVVGRAHLAQRTELLADLLSLLHTGSERVQRQVCFILLIRK